MAVINVQRGKDTDHIIARRNSQKPMIVTEMSDKSPAIRFQLEAEHKANAPDAIKEMIMVRYQLL
jgi:hypothetical protein